MHRWALMSFIAATAVTVSAQVPPAPVIHVDDDAAPGGNGTGEEVNR